MRLVFNWRSRDLADHFPPPFPASAPAPYPPATNPPFGPPPLPPSYPPCPALFFGPRASAGSDEMEGFIVDDEEDEAGDDGDEDEL